MGEISSENQSQAMIFVARGRDLRKRVLLCPGEDKPVAFDASLGESDGLPLAIDCFSKAIALWPECAEAWLERGIAKFILHGDAISDLRHAWRLGSLTTRQKENLLQYFHGQERRDLIVPELKVLDSLRDPKRNELWLCLSFSLAISYTEEANFREAATTLSSLVDSDRFQGASISRSTCAWFLADSYVALGEEAKAETVLANELDRVLTLEPHSNRQELVELALKCKIHQKKYTEAIAELNKYLSLLSEESFGLLRSFLKSLKGSEVPDALQWAQQARPKSFERGVLEWRGGAKALARETFRQFINSQRNEPQMQWEIRKARMFLQRIAE